MFHTQLFTLYNNSVSSVPFYALCGRVETNNTIPIPSIITLPKTDKQN